MNVFLMYPDRDFDMEKELAEYTGDLCQDLDFNVVFDVMGGGDSGIRKIAETAMLLPMSDAEEILYRQDVLKDCLAFPEVVQQLYGLSSEVIDKESKNYLNFFKSYPEQILGRSVNVLELFSEALGKLRGIAEKNISSFQSKGFRNFFGSMISELNSDYMSQMKRYLKMLKFPNGIHAGTSLESGLHAEKYVLHSGASQKQNIFGSLLGKKGRYFTYTISDQDSSQERGLSSLKDRALADVASAVLASCSFILNYFHSLKNELSFYLGCLNLHRHLLKLGVTTCFPGIQGGSEKGISTDSISNLGLVLAAQNKISTNNLEAKDRKLVIITGANQGGKTSFLKSIAQAQIMMQCGMFVAAHSYIGSVTTGIYTHFTREEDASMTSGKLDEELTRMSRLVDEMSPGSIVFFNDSFASTNEREGSEIAKQIINALLACDITVYVVTHFYQLSHGYEKLDDPSFFFLRADRDQSGARSYKILPGLPKKTGFSQDIYKQIVSA